MQLGSILKKSKQRICTPTSKEAADYRCNFDIEQFALTKMANSEIADKIMSSLSNPAVAAGIGATVAGVGSFANKSKIEGESEEEFQKRRIKDSILNGLAGAAIGAATPTVVEAVSSFAPKKPRVMETVGEAAKGLLGDALLLGGVGGITHGVDRWRAGKFLNSLQLDDNGAPKIIAALKPKYDWAKAIVSPLFPPGGSTNATPISERLWNSIKGGKLKNPLIAMVLAAAAPTALAKYDQIISR
jgi:hypothetical protein